jgi:PAS domain-containing protein
VTTLDTLIDYKQLVEALADAVVVADPSGAIRFWSPAAERLFGFTEGEAVGNSLDLIVPERFRERHWAGYKRTMATGQTGYAHDVLRVPAVVLAVLGKRGNGGFVWDSRPGCTILLLGRHSKEAQRPAS